MLLGRSSRSFFGRSFFSAVFVATLCALAVRLFLLEDYRIASNSMSPGLETGDLVFVWKGAYNVRLPFSTYELAKFRRPSHSEVVSFSLPDRGIETFVKRVIAVEGDKVEIHGGKVVVNGTPLHYRPVPGFSDRLEEQDTAVAYTIRMERAPQDYGPVDIPPGHFFALGDNRFESTDSRAWGPIPYSCLKGRVELRWLSLDSHGAVRKDRNLRRINESSRR